MSNAVENFLKTREKYKAQMAQSNTTGKGQGNFKGSNELDLCGKNLGMTMGVFIDDINQIPYRVIMGFRSFRINKEVAQKYDIKNFELRLADPKEYANASESEKELISKLIKKIETVEKNWSAWEGKIAKYPPRYVDAMTIQYMKVLQKLDANMNPDPNVSPGVKVLKSRSKAYYRAFDALVSSTQAATGGLEFLGDLISRDVKNRNIKYSIQVTRPQYYNFVITQVPAHTEITDEDLRVAGDLNTEVVDVTRVDVETLNKWNKMFNEEYKAIKDSVEQGSQEPVVTPVVTAEPEEVPAPAPEEPKVADSFDDSDPFS